MHYILKMSDQITDSFDSWLKAYAHIESNIEIINVVLENKCKAEMIQSF